MITPGALNGAPGATWPLSSVLPPMGALVTAPATARTHVRAVLAGWRLDDLADACELVASELVTNAVRASAGRSGSPVYVGGRMAVVRLCLLSDGSRLLVEVHDQAPGVPVLRNVGPDAESGRGLPMIAMLTGGRWGWRELRGLPGKCVWAELPVPGQETGQQLPYVMD